MKCYPVPSTLCDKCSLKLLRLTEEMHLQENSFFDLDPKVKVAWSVTQYPLHHVTYSGTKFEIAMFNGLGDTFTWTKNIICRLTLTQSSRS